MNRNKFTIYCLLLLCAVFGSCKKFLKEYSQDQIRPSTTTDLIALMYSDAYPYSGTYETFDMLTDDIVSNGVAPGYNNVPVSAYLTSLQNGMAMFKFDPTMFESSQIIPTQAYAYTIYYNKIKGCNVILDYLDKVTGGEVDKNAIKGQCLFLRAYYYLKLVTTYGQPYSGQGINPQTSLGVPLILSSTVKDGGLSRNSLKEVYDQIETDLLASADLLKANYTPLTSFRVGSTAAYACLSRFYLYRGLDTDWDKVISYAGLALADRPVLTQLNTFYNASSQFVNAGIYASGTPEVIWVYGSNPNTDYTYFPSLQGYYPLPYTVSAALGQLYERGNGTTNQGDLRYQAYFSTYTSGSVVLFKTGKAVNNSNYGTKGFRVAELYLNRAEAYIRKFIKSGSASDRTLALADINTLRISRFDTRNVAYTPVVITDATSLYQFYQNERRRELCLEDQHRWEDIRRWGLSVNHTFTNTDASVTQHTLAANSLLYALPIPYTVIANNPSLIQNPR